MNNILIYSDLHITQSSLKECIFILEEIGMLANKYNVDTLINLGDTFDNLKPNSSELDIFATFIRRLGNKKHIIIAADSHESETQTVSIVNHFGILNEMITVKKEYKNNNHLYCGHFSIKESSKNYDAKLSKEDLKNYIYVFLGHIHSNQIIKPNICHLGSCRFINFDEAEDKHKIVALITNYDTKEEQLHFLKLKTPIPMQELRLSKNKFLGESNDAIQAEKMPPQGKESGFLGYFEEVSALSVYLDQLNPKTKVKVKILDFESYREFLTLVNKYTSKFEIFKYTTEFDTNTDLTPIRAKNETINFKESFTSWLEQQNVDPKIKEILLKEIK